ncbi:hypothetical protein TNCV_1051491 [Trichonephila clavipes]|nr:hypothetical protein TNCV_1051491 [Trichonephila clavipes]
MLLQRVFEPFFVWFARSLMPVLLQFDVQLLLTLLLLGEVVGDGKDELNAQCVITTGTNRSIVSKPQELLHLKKDNLTHIQASAIETT